MTEDKPVSISEEANKFVPHAYDEFNIQNSVVGLLPTLWAKEELEKIINAELKKHDLSLDIIRQGRRIAKPENSPLWQEEHLACIVGSLWQNLPIANRIDWIGEFVGRSRRQIQALLGIYYQHWKKDPYEEPYCLGDIPFDYYWDIERFFIDFYKLSPHYIYRDTPYTKEELESVRNGFKIIEPEPVKEITPEKEEPLEIVVKAKPGAAKHFSIDNGTYTRTDEECKTPLTQIQLDTLSRLQDKGTYIKYTPYPKRSCKLMPDNTTVRIDTIIGLWFKYGLSEHTIGKTRYFFLQGKELSIIPIISEPTTFSLTAKIGQYQLNMGIQAPSLEEAKDTITAYFKESFPFLNTVPLVTQTETD